MAGRAWSRKVASQRNALEAKNLVAARVGNWKWVDMGGGAGGLFDLDRDIGEQKDLTKERPEVLRMVKERYENWLSQMEATEPRGPFRDF